MQQIDLKSDIKIERIMNIIKSIDSECKCLESYFHKQFELMEEAVAEEATYPIDVEDADAEESQASYHGYSHLIKPSMVMNIYSLLDFRTLEICNYQKINKKLDSTYNDIKRKNDIKGKNDFQTYHNYLTKYAGVNLDTATSSYNQIQFLREVRNIFIHKGGYVPADKTIKFSSKKGVTLGILNLINIEDDFIWDILEDTRKYLHTAAIV